MECLDTDLLCMHLDNELEGRLHQEVAEHLNTCQGCADRLRTLQEHDARLRSAFSGLSVTKAPGRGCASAEALSAYASGLLKPQEALHFEQHLHTCDVCLHEVMAIYRTLRLLKQEAMLVPPASLVAAVQNEVAGAAPKVKVEKLGALIVQVARDGLRFVQTTLPSAHLRLAGGGHAIPAAVFRSPREETEAVALLDLRQTVRDLEIHITVLHEERQTVLLTVQIWKQGKPLAKRRVSLTRHGRTLSSRPTSPRGTVDFPRVAPGDYTIRIPQEHVEMQCILRAAEEGR